MPGFDLLFFSLKWKWGDLCPPQPNEGLYFKGLTMTLSSTKYSLTRYFLLSSLNSRAQLCSIKIKLL